MGCNRCLYTEVFNFLNKTIPRKQLHGDYLKSIEYLGESLILALCPLWSQYPIAAHIDTMSAYATLFAYFGLYFIFMLIFFIIICLICLLVLLWYHRKRGFDPACELREDTPIARRRPQAEVIRE